MREADLLKEQLDMLEREGDIKQVGDRARVEFVGGGL